MSSPSTPPRTDSAGYYMLVLLMVAIFAMLAEVALVYFTSSMVFHIAGALTGIFAVLVVGLALNARMQNALARVGSQAQDLALGHIHAVAESRYPANSALAETEHHLQIAAKRLARYVKLLQEPKAENLPKAAGRTDELYHAFASFVSHEHQLAAELQNLNQANHVGQALLQVSLKDPATFERSVVENLSKALLAEYGCFYNHLVDNVGSARMVRTSAFSPVKLSVHDRKFKVEDCIAGAALRKKRLEFFSAPPKHYELKTCAPSGFKLSQLLILPLIVEGKPIGAFEFGTSTDMPLQAIQALEKAQGLLQGLFSLLQRPVGQVHSLGFGDRLLRSLKPVENPSALLNEDFEVIDFTAAFKNLVQDNAQVLLRDPMLQTGKLSAQNGNAVQLQAQFNTPKGTKQLSAILLPIPVPDGEGKRYLLMLADHTPAIDQKRQATQREADLIAETETAQRTAGQALADLQASRQTAEALRQQTAALQTQLDEKSEQLAEALAKPARPGRTEELEAQVAEFSAQKQQMQAQAMQLASEAGRLAAELELARGRAQQAEQAYAERHTREQEPPATHGPEAKPNSLGPGAVLMALAGAALVFELDDTGRIISANALAATLLGYSAAEMTNQPLTRFLDPTIQQHETETLQRCINGGMLPQQLEVPFVRKAGGRLWARLCVAPIQHEGLAGKHYIILGTDVTPLAEAVAKLQQSIQELEGKQGPTQLPIGHQPQADSQFSAQLREQLQEREAEVAYLRQQLMQLQDSVGREVEALAHAYEEVIGAQETEIAELRNFVGAKVA